MSRDFKIALSSAALATMAMYLAMHLFRDRWIREYDLRQAGESLPKVQAVIEADPRFREVEAATDSGMARRVWISGEVENNDNLLRLMQAIAAKRLPLVFEWKVIVIENEPK